MAFFSASALERAVRSALERAVRSALAKSHFQVRTSVQNPILERVLGKGSQKGSEKGRRELEGVSQRG